MKGYIVFALLLLSQMLLGQDHVHENIHRENEYYEIQNIKTPEGLSVETGGLAFMPDGRLIACFHRGEIMTYNSATKEWKLFASGVHDPLGILPISDSEIIVMQRPELTRISDTNGDGLADKYQTITDDFGLSGNYHEFAFGPKMDKEGNMFIALNLASNGAGIRDEVRGTYDSLGRPGRMYSCVPYRGWVIKVTPDGKFIPWAHGFRSPNTLGFDSKGNLFVADNQGDWLGTSKLYHVKEGRFYGHPSSLVWKPGNTINPLKIAVDKLNANRTEGAVLFPHDIMANSPTEPVCDETKGRFGPFGEQMFIGEMDQGRIIRVMLEEVEEEIQGACISFLEQKDGLKKGNNRLVFAPDGSLWVGQNDHGWVGDEGIQRIVYKGKTPMEIQSVKLTPKGFDLTFTQPVDDSSASNMTNYLFKRYYYEYHRAYGSPQMDVHPVKVTGLNISEDKRKVSLTLNEMIPGYIYELNLSGLLSENKTPLANTFLCYTLNRLRK